MKNKTKNILIIALSIMLVGLIGAMGAIFGKTDWNNLKNKVNELTQQEEVVETKNLLLNSNFQLDSSDIVFKTNENVAVKNNIVDDWIRQGSSDATFEIYKSQAGLHVNVTDSGSSDGFYIQQYFCREFGKYSDMPLTFSTSVNGVIYSNTFEFNDENKGEIQIFELFSSVNIGFAYLEVDGAGYKVLFKVTGPVEFVINWVQVEEGNVFTGYNG